MSNSSNSTISRTQLSPNRTLILRELTQSDWPQWRSLRLQALREAPYAFRSQLRDWQGSGDTEDRWRSRLSSVALNLIAVLDDQPAGMLSATTPNDSRTVELISMWVAPEFRGAGVGDGLLEAAAKWAEGERAYCMTLDVMEGNEHAIKLYQRNGFVDAGEMRQTTVTDKPERRFLKVLEFSR